MIEAHPDVSSLPPATGKITRALLSVFDKTGIVELAQALSARGVELLSSGGTARVLSEASVEVVPVDTYTGANADSYSYSADRYRRAASDIDRYDAH